MKLNKTIIEKKKKGSNEMAKPNNCLIRNYNNFNDNKYLNVSVNDNLIHVGMAEWSTQLFDTQCPSGCVGSIPTPGVIV